MSLLLFRVSLRKSATVLEAVRDFKRETFNIILLNSIFKSFGQLLLILKELLPHLGQIHSHLALVQRKLIHLVYDNSLYFFLVTFVLFDVVSA